MGSDKCIEPCNLHHNHDVNISATPEISLLPLCSWPSFPIPPPGTIDRSPPTSKRQIQSVKWGKEDKTNCKAVPKKRLEGSPRGSGAAFRAGRPWAPSPPGDVFLAGAAGSQRVTDAQATPCIHPSSAQGTRLLSCQVQAAEGDPEANWEPLLGQAGQGRAQHGWGAILDLMESSLGQPTAGWRAGDRSESCSFKRKQICFSNLKYGFIVIKQMFSLYS